MTKEIKIEFEHDYQKKIMIQTFPERERIQDAVFLSAWRSQWMKELSGWHSPYKVLIEGRGSQLELDVDGLKTLGRMFDFFSAVHMRKAIAVDLILAADLSAADLPFTLASSREEADTLIGVRSKRVVGAGADFRSLIQIENHFRQQVMEVTFEGDVCFDSEEKLAIFRSKISNQLMQWHSSWNLLIDCAKADIAEELLPAFGTHLRALKGFFLKEIVGYGAKADDRNWPFKVYRARHRAAAALESEGLFDAAVANCASRSQRPR